MEKIGKVCDLVNAEARRKKRNKVLFKVTQHFLIFGVRLFIQDSAFVPCTNRRKLYNFQINLI